MEVTPSNRIAAQRWRWCGQSQWLERLRGSARQGKGCAYVMDLPYACHRANQLSKCAANGKRQEAPNWLLHKHLRRLDQARLQGTRVRSNDRSRK